MRYAIYFIPQASDALFLQASRLLGYDCIAREKLEPPVLLEISSGSVSDITAEPRRYGFHATIKAPFRLAPGFCERNLRDAFETFCKDQASVPRLTLQPMVLKNFIALVPTTQTSELAALAQNCVEALDSFRAPLTDIERLRRRGFGLDLREAQLFERWGYPYVCELYRFHMTLTGPLPIGSEMGWLRAIDHYLGDTSKHVEIDTLCLCVQPSPQDRFYVEARCRLAVSSRNETSAVTP